MSFKDKMMYSIDMLKQFFNFLDKEARKSKIRNECGCICFCACGEPLNDKSTCVEIDLEIYTYTCAKCNTKSTFHFGLAPVPIKINKKDFIKDTHEKGNI